MEIRIARNEDLPAVRELAIQSYRETFGANSIEENMVAFFNENYSLDKIRKELDEPESMLYLAWEGDKMIAFLRLRISKEVEGQLGDNTLELQRLYVHKDFYGKQVANKLMELAIAYATGKKFKWLWLGVWEKNFRAQRFYQKFGFEQFGEHIFMEGNDPQLDWLMKKKL